MKDDYKQILQEIEEEEKKLTYYKSLPRMKVFQNLKRGICNP